VSEGRRKEIAYKAIDGAKYVDETRKVAEEIMNVKLNVQRELKLWRL